MNNEPRIEHIEALKNHLELSKEYENLQQEHLALIKKYQHFLTKGTEIFNLIIAENNTSTKAKALAKEILKEILQPANAGKKLSKTEQFEIDVQANLNKGNLELIRKRSKKPNKGSF